MTCVGKILLEKYVMDIHVICKSCFTINLKNKYINLKFKLGCLFKGSKYIGLHVFIFQCSVKIMQLWSYDEETDEVHPGENVKLKVSGVEEEV